MELKLRVVDLEARKIVYYSDECCLVNAIDLYESDKTKYRLNLWTGLHDKSGEDVYEGDIVIDDGVKRVVDFTDGCFICRNSIPTVPLTTGEEPLEVIGNIYENPELLK